MYADFRSPLDGRQLIAQEKSQAKWEISATQTKYAIDEVEKAKFHLYHDADAGEPSDAKPGLPNKAQRRLRYTNIDNQTGNNPEIIWADTRNDDYYGIQRRCPPRQTLGGKFAGMFPSAFLQSVGNTERGGICTGRRHIECPFCTALFRWYSPVPNNGCNSLVFVDPLDGTFCGIVVPGCPIEIIQEVNAPNGTHFSGGLFQIFKLCFVVLDEIGRVCIEVVVVRTAIFLLTRDNMLAVLVAEILIKSFGAVGGVRVGELSGWLEVG